MSENETVTVEIDFVMERGETIDSAMTSMVTGHDVSLELVTEAGPAGGNPLGKVIGSRHAVREFLDANGYEVELYLS